ncbi:MAG: T9SS type A sorting domain-containing protein [Bacteroidota bacterium]
MRTFFVALLVWCTCSISAQTRLIANPDSTTCCFTFDYSLLPSDQPINNLEVSLPPNVQWDSYQVDLAGGWRIFPIPGQNGFQIFFVDSQNNPLDFPEEVMGFFSACFELNSFEDEVPLTVEWKRNASVQARESLFLNCGNCALLLRTEVSCLDEGGYELSFSFVNNSAYPMDEIRLAELGSTGALADTSIPLNTILAPGDTSDVIVINLAPAAEGLDEICFYLTGSRSEGEFRIDCCTAQRCIELPVCDRCCTDFDSFEMDVAQGFQFDFFNQDADPVCDNFDIEVSALALNDCDQVTFSLRNLEGAGSTISTDVVGRDTALFGPNALPGLFEVCMSVRRVNLEGEGCFDENVLQVCDTFDLTCDLSCGSFADFQSDVEAGFMFTTLEIGTNCDSATISLFPNGINPDTDTVLFYYTFEGSNETDTAFGGIMDSLENGIYEICMEVTRYNSTGDACFASLTYCELVPVDCISRLRYLDAQDHFTIYPNPVSHTLYVEGDRPAEVLVLYNAIGQKIREERIAHTNFRYELAVGDLAAGVYILVLQDDTGRSYQTRIICK